MQKVVGIIGGMGPLATVDLMKKIISFTRAKEDQDHIHIIADNYPQIPDRTAAIVGNGIAPTSFMIESAQRLENAGADILVIACNTAHFFYEAVQQAVHIPILHMPFETVCFLKEQTIKKVGLLATDGTIMTNLYQSSCLQYNIDIELPDKQLQKLVMEGIYAIKSGRLEKGQLYLSTVAETLEERHVDAIIAGCTEVPIVLQSSEKIQIIDPTEIAARKIVTFVKKSSEKPLGV